MSKGILHDYIQNRKDSVTYVTEGILLALNEQIVSLMEEKHMNRSQLAKKLGTSSAYITKLLNGMPNLTIETMVKIAQALDAKLDIGMIPMAENTTDMNPIIKQKAILEKEKGRKRKAS